MKHLKRIFESNAPIDVEHDIEKYRDMIDTFTDNDKVYYLRNSKDSLEELVEENPTMVDSNECEYYGVYESQDELIFIVKGVSKLHASLVVSTVFKDPYLFEDLISDENAHYIQSISKDTINYFISKERRLFKIMKDKIKYLENL